MRATAPLAELCWQSARSACRASDHSRFAWAPPGPCRCTPARPPAHRSGRCRTGRTAASPRRGASRSGEPPPGAPGRLAAGGSEGGWWGRVRGEVLAAAAAEARAAAAEQELGRLRTGGARACCLAQADPALPSPPQPAGTHGRKSARRRRARARRAAGQRTVAGRAPGPAPADGVRWAVARGGAALGRELPLGRHAGIVGRVCQQEQQRQAPAGSATQAPWAPQRAPAGQQQRTWVLSPTGSPGTWLLESEARASCR